MTLEEFKKEIAPKMKKGWVAMDADGQWFFYDNEPDRLNLCWSDEYWSLVPFDIIPVSNWKKSLVRTGCDSQSTKNEQQNNLHTTED